jgi:predicted kinase
MYIIIRGPLGCGKSTISEELAQKLGAEHISMDRVLDDCNLTDDEEDGYISQKSFKKANEIIAPKAQKILEAGKTIIFDGNFYWKSQIEDLINRLEYPHQVFTLKAPLDVCIDRDSKRNKTPVEGAAKAVYKKSTEFEYGNVVNVDRPLEECVEEILSYILK